MNFPRRIVCLTDETTELLYLLGEQDRIVGVSGFCKRPPEARSKPRVATFTDANIEAIAALKPDMVLTFSDVQAEITRQLALAGFTVLNFNQRRVSEIFDMMGVVSRLVGKQQEGDALAEKLLRGLDAIAETATKFPRKPRIYFEEWNDPLISGIGWVEDLIEIAGGEVVFPELRGSSKAEGRVVNPAEVIKRNPDIIFASWCGMKVKIEEIKNRPGWEAIRAVREGHVYEINSDCILQPGPASLTEGVCALHEKIAAWALLDPAEAGSRSGESNGVLL